MGLDETTQLQPDMLKILEAWLGHKITWTQSKLGDSQPIITGRVGQHTVLLVKLKTDKGGNARAELLVRSSKPCNLTNSVVIPPTLQLQ